ncbi:unnamed protein product [Tuber melanosporum]|uniref:(Perigord truffle) hypothetical protein n=1 Tax=Tuber melanosporum (strain Mel28) TaxID=656061 RepID=D5GNH2_TUBMM|nr:uncharacterized protein GSTUM_00011290001 [Tuber melanosporum]CAZ86065.1 unnamed protein product [Tuber melanosporum]
MGQQPSKRPGEKGSAPASSSTTSLGVDGNTLPITKSDTQGSTRSIRGSIRNKIAASTNKDSPSTSLAALPSATDKSDAASVRSSTSARSRRESRSSNPNLPPSLTSSLSRSVPNSEPSTSTNTPYGSTNSLVPPPATLRWRVERIRRWTMSLMCLLDLVPCNLPICKRPRNRF